MVDIHSHILPEVDDGAKTWEIATEMVRMAARDGITHMVATPHANGQYEYDRAAHTRRLARLAEATDHSMELSLGCDFHFSFENIQEALADKRRYAIGNTRYLLVEFSDYAIPPNVVETLGELKASGLRPVITHPERNLILQQKPERILEFADMGCVVQVTANSVTGFWGGKPKAMARWLLEKNAVHVLATDAHDLKRRPPVLSAARDEVKKLRGPEVAEYLVTGNPLAVVSDEDLPYFPHPLM